ncbi:unnamed protein product [Camellia sinensis]
MGFPIGYSGRFIPKLILLILSLLDFIKKLLRFVYLRDFPEPQIAWPPLPEFPPEPHSVSPDTIRELLPVLKFSDLVQVPVDPPEICAVCLYEFAGDDDIRRLSNCRHIFHRSCLDRWIDHGHRTCPLCRTRFVNDDLLDAFNEKIWESSEIPNSYGDYSPISSTSL